MRQLGTWNRAQWKVARRTYLVALLLMGIVGETLPGASYGRIVPLEWWNWVTIAVAPVLIALIAATFVTEGGPKRSRRTAKASAGTGATIGTLAMACPACNPLAIALFGGSGVLSFLAPERGLIALLSVVLLLVTLVLRLRTVQACTVTYRQTSSAPSPSDQSSASPSR
ncbi:hypothetical protein [Rugosimonospora africana]|uniref:hypothetical protein n=1 Tax=Rugosimonospora africana TaxID=556532 RepID=UPI001945824C|nr:hypothetical protein [Rugosimonospora africana]